MRKRIAIFTLAFLLLSMLCSAQHDRYVGGDISMLPAYEKAGNVYLDRKGKKIDDLVKWFVTECGWNTFRVRLFVNPCMSNAMYQNIDYVRDLGKRIKASGANFMLDIHYSDSWADPATQFIPSVWKDASDEEMAAKIGEYTETVLHELKQNGAEPDFVQIGNEVSYGMCLRGMVETNGGFVSAEGDKVYPALPRSQRETQWNRLCRFLNAASKAVRDNSNAQIIVHIERTNVPAECVGFFKSIEGVDYDVIGLSYYPFWHGYLASLSETLKALKLNFPTRKVQIVETAYNFQYSFDNPVFDTSDMWPISADGQYSFVKDLVAELAGHDNVDGLLYWFPEEAGNGDRQNVLGGWVNRGLWWANIGSNNGHWPVTSNGSDVPHLLKSFLEKGQTGIMEVAEDRKPGSPTYNIAGQRTASSSRGVRIYNRKKILK